MKKDDLALYKYDWGMITADSYQKDVNEIFLVFNIDLRNEFKIKNAIQFVVGKVFYGVKHFPSNSKITLRFDIRGQEMIMARSKKFKESLLDYLQGINHKNSITIEFLR
jgi:hypothetical protein